jgi:hypothetical protein
VLECAHRSTQFLELSLEARLTGETFASVPPGTHRSRDLHDPATVLGGAIAIQIGAYGQGTPERPSILFALEILIALTNST